jgi:pilus assembly protein CpaD
MSRSLICLTLAAALLAACTPAPEKFSDSDAAKALRTTPKQLHVDGERLVHATAFGHGSAQLAEGERGSLADFLTASDIMPDARIYLQPPADDHVSRARIATLIRDLSRQGHTVAVLPPSSDVVQPDHLLVIVQRYVVSLPNCPDWTKPSSTDDANTLASNFGCATMTDLGLMVADPRDLVVGRKLGPSDAGEAGLAIQRYRTDNTLPLPAESAGEVYGAPAPTASGAAAPPTLDAGN